MKQSKDNKKSISAIRKSELSQYWSEQSRARKEMKQHVAIFIEQANIKVISPEDPIQTKISVSTIVTTKGKIIIN